MEDNKKIENGTKEEIQKVEKIIVEKEKTRFLFKVPILVIIVCIALVGFLILPAKKFIIKIDVKSTLEKLVEKSDLETVNITYNTIAKKCKEDEICDLNSNDIDDFYYVVSCKGTITAGIDFDDVKIDVDSKNKKIIVKMPDAKLIGEPNIISSKFLNGSDLPASLIPEARAFCQETTKQKSEEDKKLIPAAKEQARIVLEEFYGQWIKVYDSSYRVEVR